MEEDGEEAKEVGAGLAGGVEPRGGGPLSPLLSLQGKVEGSTVEGGRTSRSLVEGGLYCRGVSKISTNI